MVEFRAPSARPEFAGFGEFYCAEIAPYLAEKEIARRATVTNFAILVGSLGTLAVAVILRGPFGDANVQIGFFIALAAASVSAWLLNRTRDDIGHGLLERISRRLNFAYEGRLGRPDYYDAFRELKLLPDHNIESWEDEVRGAHAGGGFVLCEANLKYRTSGKNSRVKTVFHGQLFAIDYPKRFLSRTVVMRDRGALNRFFKPGREFSRVGLVSSEFEKAFEAWSTDQVEARELLDPLVLERFQELERLFRGKNLRAAFSNGALFVAIETGDRLNMGSMFRPLENPRRVERVLKEFDVIFDLIDVLVKRVDKALDGAFSLAELN